MNRKKTSKNPGAGFPATAVLSPKEKKALKNAIRALNGQAESLGVLDPLEMEPVLVYSFAGREK